MKKIGIGIIGIISLSLLITACGGTPKAATQDELDMAIRDASDYLNDNIPQGSKIVILNVQSDSTALSDYIIDELIANAVNDRLFEVVDRQQLDLIRTEQNFQYSGEVDDNLAMEVGKFFGAQIIVSGRVSQVANRYRFTIRALEVQTARVVGQNNINIAAGETITSLMKSGSGGTGTTATASGGRTQTGTTSGTATPTAATPAAPAATISNGTYTFWPRPGAVRGGIETKKDYIVKIVVRGNYFNIYITSVAVGRGDANRGTSGVWEGSNNVFLQDVDRPSRPPYNMQSYAPDNEGNLILTFQNVTGTRFNLINSYHNPPVIFEEFTLGERDEP